jgi:hypothetical protein
VPFFIAPFFILIRQFTINQKGRWSAKNIFGKDAKMKMCLFVSLLLVGLLTGCASIIHGPTEQITFTSEPTHAMVTVNGQKMETPAVVLLKRNGKNKAHFTKEGYESQEVAVKCNVDMWFLLGNLGFGGIPGWIIDGINGSAGDLEDNIHVSLISEPQASTAK